MVYDPVHGCVRGGDEPLRRKRYPVRYDREDFVEQFEMQLDASTKIVDPIIRPGGLVFTIGIARSGKSTYATRWAQFLEDWHKGQQIFPRAIACGDDIRLALHGERFNKDAEPMVWAIHTYMVKAMLSRGHDVIIDGTNTTEDSLWRILNIDHRARHILIDTPAEVCKQRAIECGHKDLVEKGVIDRQAKQLQVLKDEGIDNIVDRIRRRVRERWQMP